MRPAGSCVLVLSLAAFACAELHEDPKWEGQDVRLTFLHTSDIHSRLLPYRMQVSYTDATFGLNQDNEPFGGVARIAHIINREREKSARSLYIDTGDVFQGAPIFNAFKGEAEFRAMSYLRPDAFAIGNHEFDTGLDNLIVQAKSWITFPVIAANYFFMPDNALGEMTFPFTIVNVDGVKVGIIGVGDFSSLSSLTDIGNSLKMMPLAPEEIVQDWVNVLRPQVDLVVLASHAGLRHDQEIIEGICGVDIVFGGHLHIVLKPPKTVKSKCGEDVLLVHSGAFAKFVGRLDVVAHKDSKGRLVVASHEYQLFPVDSTVPEEPSMAQLMEEYRLKLNQLIDLTSVYGYCPKLLTKYGFEGADSSLGNLVSEAIRKYARVDIAFTNTLGIRANMFPGPITLDDLFNIFPFENTITLMYMSGTDLRSLFDYNAGRSSGRGCVSQIQVAGIEFLMNCSSAPPEYFFECWNEELMGCTGGCAKQLEEHPEKAGENSACLRSCIDKDYRECLAQKVGETGNPPLIEDSLCVDRCIDVEAEPGKFWDEFKWCLRDCFPRAENIAITDCPDPMKVEDPSECSHYPLVDSQVYEVATNDYIAQGGSGFTILKSNNTQTDTKLPLRDAVQEVIVTSGDCLGFCLDRDGDVDLAGCSVYQGCLEGVNKFYSGFCEKVDKTGGAEFFAKAPDCAVDTGACFKDPDCYCPEIDPLCAGGKCKACKASAQCMVEDPDSFCVDGACMKRTHVCMEGRCMRRCETGADCPYEVSAGETICAKGVCQVPPSTSCMSDAECIRPFSACFADAAPCQFDSDCGPGTYCRAGACIPQRPACKTDGECDGAPCLFGRCGGVRVACGKDSDCPDGAACRGDACNWPCGNCSAEEDCPPGLACVKNVCLHLHASCVDNRCRTWCTAQADCKSGELCLDGMCVPAACTVDLTGEERCLVNASWKAQQTCLNAPCVDSKVDGRIGRILPENMGELEFGYIPNDPEDLDEF